MAPALKTIGSRYSPDLIEKIDRDAKRLELTQSEWMRMSVDLTLAAKVTRAQAAPWRRPPTRAQLRAMGVPDRRRSKGEDPGKREVTTRFKGEKKTG